MTAEQLAELAAAGQFWWVRPDGTFYATATREPADESDHYVLNAAPGWVAQWDGDWDRAAEVMAPLFARLNEFLNQQGG